MEGREASTILYQLSVLSFSLPSTQSATVEPPQRKVSWDAKITSTSQKLLHERVSYFTFNNRSKLQRPFQLLG